MSQISNAVEDFKDWAMTGPAQIFAIIAGSSVALVGAVVLPAAMTAKYNFNNLEKSFDTLDKVPTAVFRSFNECIAQGHSSTTCKSSQQQALNVAGSIGTEVYYRSEKECVATHGKCKTVDRSHTDSLPPKEVKDITYYPIIAGWQVAQNDINIAVPLYSSAKPNIVLRQDGKEFHFN